MIQGQSDPADQVDPWELEACALLLQPAVEGRLELESLQTGQTQDIPADQDFGPATSSPPNFRRTTSKAAQERHPNTAASQASASLRSAIAPLDEPHAGPRSQNLQPQTDISMPYMAPRYGSKAGKHLRPINCSRNGKKGSLSRCPAELLPAAATITSAWQRTSMAAEQGQVFHNEKSSTAMQDCEGLVNRIRPDAADDQESETPSAEQSVVRSSDLARALSQCPHLWALCKLAVQQSLQDGTADWAFYGIWWSFCAGVSLHTSRLT